LVLLVAVTTAVVAGGALWLVGRRGVADALWAAATLAAIVPAILLVVRSLVRRQVGVDVIAVLALATRSRPPAPSRLATESRLVAAGSPA
jgi:hypothetical protein